MCFSATASLAAGAFLLGVGVLTLRMARQRSQLPYAAINAAATMLYSLFSHVLWPVYVPLAAWLLERAPARRRALGAVAMVGIAVDLYLLTTLLTDGVVARPIGQHIEYDAPHLYIPVVMTLYLVATTLSLLLSSHGRVRLFGALAFAASVVAYLAYARWFISVWCFFAAQLSIVVCLHLSQHPSRLAGARP